jgi:hypothetical protein
MHGSQAVTVAQARTALREIQSETRWLRRAARLMLLIDAVALIALLVYKQWVPFL